MKAYASMRRGSIFTLLLKLSFTLRPVFHGRNSPIYLLNVGLDGPERASGCCEEISYFCRELNYHSSVIQPIVQSLYRLRLGRPIFFSDRRTLPETQKCVSGMNWPYDHLQTLKINDRLNCNSIKIWGGSAK